MINYFLAGGERITGEYEENIDDQVLVSVRKCTSAGIFEKVLS